MKETLSKVKYFLPAEKMQSNLAIFLSIFALFFAVGNSNVPCLSADTCAVGSDEVFSGTVTIQNNTNYGVKLTGNPTANRTITFPDADGTVKLAGATLTANKILASDTNGEVSVTDKYPFTLGTAGQFLKVASTGTTVDFLTVGGLDSLTADAPYLSVNSSGAIDSSATLTASTPLKSSASGQITASDLDPTTDIAVGSATAGQVLQVGTSSALEWANPSGGGSVSLTAKGSVTGGKVVATVVDGNDLKVEPITSLQASANTSVYAQASISSSAGNRYFHYNEVDDRYLECNYLSGYFQCRTGTINTGTNEITWNSFATISSTFSWASASMLQKACAYADNPSHNYYMCVVMTSQGNNNYSRILTFSIDSTGSTIDTGEMDFKICEGNYGYTYGRCRQGVPVFDTQTDTWVIAHAIDGPTSSTGFSGQYGVVVSKDIIMNTNETCNGVPCGFPSNYAYSLKVSYPSGSPNSFDQNRWQPVADCQCLPLDEFQFAYLNDGDSTIYEYMLAVYPNASQGGFDQGGWSTIYMERTSGTGAYTLGTPDYNVNDQSANTSNIFSFCNQTGYDYSPLQRNTYGQGTSDVGVLLDWFCQENSSWGGDGMGRMFGNFFTPNTTTNTFDKANTEGIELYNPNDSIFAGNISTSGYNYIQYMTTEVIGNYIWMTGANYFNNPVAGYWQCQSNYYCPIAFVVEFNSTKTDFTPKSFYVWSTDQYAMGTMAVNGDLSNLVTFLASNVSNSDDVSYVTPTVDKNRSNWIGFLSTSASDGDTVSVNIISGKATGLTGLVAGTKYYVGGDGSLSTSGDVANEFCIAVSQTECLILNSNF